MKSLIILLILTVASATFAAEPVKAPAKKDSGMKHASKKTQEKAAASVDKKVADKKAKDAQKKAAASKK